MVCWRRRKFYPRGFTLIELLVVVGILAVLLGLLLPTLSTARDKAKAGACMANLHGIGGMLAVYGADYDGVLPPLNYRNVYTTSYVNGVAVLPPNTWTSASSPWAYMMVYGGYAPRPLGSTSDVGNGGLLAAAPTQRSIFMCPSANPDRSNTDFARYFGRDTTTGNVLDQTLYVDCSYAANGNAGMTFNPSGEAYSPFWTYGPDPIATSGAGLYTFGRCRRNTEILDPGNTALLVDGQIGQYYRSTKYWDQGVIDGNQFFHARHGGIANPLNALSSNQVNILHADGHVEFYMRSKLPRANTTAYATPASHAMVAPYTSPKWRLDQ